MYDYWYFYIVIGDIIKIKKLENNFLYMFIFIFNIIVNQKRNNYKYWLYDFEIYKLMLYVIFFIFERPPMLISNCNISNWSYSVYISLKNELRDLGDREIKIEWTDTSFELAHRPS